MKSLLFSLFVALSFASYSQTVIIAEKDSSGDYHFKEVRLPNLGGSIDAGCSVLKIVVLSDALEVYQNNCLFDKKHIIKATYKLNKEGFIISEEIKGEYVIPKSPPPYFIFTDGTSLILAN